MSIEGEIPDLRDFRNFVDSLGRVRDAELIKALYLTACRSNELMTKCCPSDHSTKARGHLGSVNLYKFGKERGNPANYILLLKLPVLKRRAKNDAVIFKHIALPCGSQFEPWTKTLLEIIKRKRNLSFDLTRQAANRIICEALKPLDPQASPRRLRHYRLSHLALHYGFTGMELAQFAGWTLKTGMGMAGAVSGNVNIYLHLGWKGYFKKLLIPLSEVLDKISLPSPADYENLEEKWRNSPFREESSELVTD